jgi:hypothetical protein
MNSSVQPLQVPQTTWISTTTRLYASATSDKSGSSPYAYVSPFQEIFDSIDGGKTFLGTTQFQAPDIKYLKCGIPEHVLKFKTSSYGKLLEAPYVRPNEHRVTLQVHMRHIPLESETERLVLREIVGHRLNEDTGVLQLSSSQFGSRIENKRHVVSMLERAIESAKLLAARVEKEVEQTEEAQPQQA